MSSFEQLLDVMHSLDAAHHSMLDLAEQKKHALIRGDVEELTRIVAKENKFIKQVGELDLQRVEAIGQYMIEKGYKPNPRVTVSDLTKIVFQAEDKKRLMEAQKKLLGAIRKLREINQLNQQLIEQSLAFIDYSLDLIAGPPENEVVYQHPQHAGGSAKRTGLFDTRA
ncbi:flagellar protein FlgN [Paenibacillus ginsengihumi]|uniref:flagellar protein FlgN n=1 Tax=Paenibacillus ginsengihumi TaxID=431596 RepID=UPI00037FF864|nr:flagellar protein FlgN [Paenibacillus ginsengihumi]